MVEPFATRNLKAFENMMIRQIAERSRKSSAPLQYFAKECINYILSNGDIEPTVKELAIDIAICTRDYKALIELTKDLDTAEAFLYRAYAYAKLRRTSKIASLKLQFHQKFASALSMPRNQFIVNAMEFLFLYGEQNYKMALMSFKKIEKVYEENEDLLRDKLYIMLIFTLGAQTFLKFNKFDKVDQYSRYVLQSAIRNKDPYFHAAALNLRISVLISKGEFKKARRLLEVATEPTEQTGIKESRAALLNNAARLEMAKGNYERAVRLLEKIFPMVKGNPAAIAINALNLSELYLIIGEKEKANMYINQAIQLEKDHNLNLVEPYLIKSWLEITENNLDAAREYLDNSQEIIQETGERRLYPQLHYYEGLYSKALGDTESAEHYFIKATEEATELKNIEILIKAEFQLTYLYFNKFRETKDLGDYTVLLSHLNNLTLLSKEQFIPRLECDLHVIKAIVLAEVGKREKAIKEVLEALALATKFKYQKSIPEIKKLLKEIEALSVDKIKSEEILKQKGFVETNKLLDVIKKYEGFKFIKNPKRINSKLYAILIVDKETGVLKYSYSTEENDVDSSIISAIVAATNIFTKQIFEDEIELQRVKHEGKELLIRPLGKYWITVVADIITFNYALLINRIVDVLTKNEELIKSLESSELQNEELEKVVKDIIEKTTIQNNNYEELETDEEETEKE